MIGNPDSRNDLWRQLLEGRQCWDMIVVGGGITGAGVFREAVRNKLKVLLLEQQDFSWGTSSRSSKMVHGGLRYFAQGDIKLVFHALRERERLLREAPGLVYRTGFVFLHRRGQFPGRWLFALLMWIYDLLAGVREHRFLKRAQVLERLPGLNSSGLKGAGYYTDAITDDSRLVLRTLQEACGEGGQALNYVRVGSLLKQQGKVTGVKAENLLNGETAEIAAAVVINATGVWADRLRNELTGEHKVRPLRGSHLIFHAETLPVSEVLAVLHPWDRRPVFIFPWQGLTVVGTTDLDHHQDPDSEAAISGEEVEYLLECVNRQYPDLHITEREVVSTFSGVRPVIAGGKRVPPSKEWRDHAVWAEQGLVTVFGGKLTTFRLIARDVLAHAKAWLPRPALAYEGRFFSSRPDCDKPDRMDDTRWQRLIGCYGGAVEDLLLGATEAELEPIEQTPFCWAEVRWALKAEAVIHLDDLMLRRTRLGLLLPNGGENLFPKLEEFCRRELDWSDERWRQEQERYRTIWRRFYYLPADFRIGSTSHFKKDFRPDH